MQSEGEFVSWKEIEGNETFYSKILSIPWAGTIGTNGAALKLRDHQFDLVQLQARPISGVFKADLGIMKGISTNEYHFNGISKYNPVGAVEIRGKWAMVPVENS